MADKDEAMRSEDNAAKESERDRNARDRSNPYTEWLREQMGESRRAKRSGDDDDAYGRSTR